MKCIVCLAMKGKNVIRGGNLTSLKSMWKKWKQFKILHIWTRREFYENKKCNHAKNGVTYSQQNHISIAKQVIHISLKGEKGKKRQQFATILQILL